MPFPKGFVWGVAAAAYQIEGAFSEDGKGLSIWDVFCRRKGAIWQGHTADVACDHYHRWKQDIGLMKSLGIPAYRFSVSWPRVLPEGTGRINPKGLDFYSRLVDGLLEAGITPYLTLFHWDYPYELHCRGGWLNPDSPDWFAEYTRAVVDTLSDRVANWMTFNEPNAVVWAGYESGFHAPGLKLGLAEILRVIHHILLAHGKSVKVIRSCAKRPSSVSFVLAGSKVKVPCENTPENIEAARQEMFGIKAVAQDSSGILGSVGETWWLDPVYRGNYPADGMSVYAECLPPMTGDDMKTICQPLDFFAVNIYRGQRVAVDKAGKVYEPHPSPNEPLVSAGTDSRWPVMPESLYWGPRFYWERYRLPVVITENGMSSNDWVCLDGKVHDARRIDFLARYLRALRKAGEDGVDIRGYFLWSILDNFEWSAGYRERFGIVYVDYDTQERIPKDSAYWYREVIRTNGAVIP